jgi:neurotransmitter:Na+ symporter, NSS family|uniref:sodium-dependent transporter n=1 Tax=Cephaloticoccus sp. TaxID=1985742 RepID=UPI00404AF48D
MAKAQEAWGSRLGVILAVAGSAVGLGNFLRFPGLAAQYGGGAFMIAYFISLLLIGIPICWVEWTLGRHGGQHGFHSTSGIFQVILRKPWGKYLGVIGFIVPVCIYMYYVYIEAWCLGYALNSITGNLSVSGLDYGAFFGRFTGASADGVALHFGLGDVGIFVLIVYVLNFFFIYRGISKGIEAVCKLAMPALIVIAIVILVRVLTLGTPDPLKPDQNVMAGLGYLWNPGDIATGLRNPQLWLAAAGQIFFSLSVGFGVIITYASYLRKNDDVVLSGLTASAANEFCEVGLGGLITVPAAFIFLGTAGIVGQGTFGLGFNVLPEVFAHMPGGQVFSSIFFLLLFLAAITSSLSMLQPGIAFLEEGLNINRKQSVALLGFVTAIGTLFIWYFSKDLKALDTIDFWVGTVMLFIQATILVIIFGWGLGIKRGWEIAHEGAEMRIPNAFKFIIKFVTPAFLLLIFSLFMMQNVFGWNYSFSNPEFNPTSYVLDLMGSADVPASSVARLSVAWIIIMTVFSLILVNIAGKNWAKRETLNH